MTHYSGSDIYCDLIIPKKIAVQVVSETDTILAFHHTKPLYATHIVVTSKEHIPSLLELPNDLAIDFLALLKEIASQVKDETGACRIVTNLGHYQDSKHFHVHVVSGVLAK